MNFSKKAIFHIDRGCEIDSAKLTQFLTGWNGDFLVRKEDGSDELASKIALEAIGPLDIKDRTKALIQIGLEKPELLGKIARLFRNFSITGSYSKADVETLLKLSTWDGGPNTEIAKSRILSCYLNQSVSLDLSNLYLTSLPDCLNSLRIINLNLSNNQLITLPSLPSDLKILNCSHNRLNSLPPLPNSLTNIDCEDNFITIFPQLPLSLKILICINNLIETPPDIPPDIIATFSLRELTPLEDLFQTLREVAGSDFSEEIDVSVFDPDFITEFSDWLALLTHQKDFEGEIGEKNLALLLLKILSLSSKDSTYFDLVKAALSEAISTCTDRALYYLNFLTVARKLKVATSESEKITILKGSFAFSFLEKIAKEIIQSRLTAKSAAIGRALLQEEIEEIEHEEIELYLALQMNLKDHFHFPIETSSMVFSGLSRLSEEELLFAKASIDSKLENIDEFLNFCANEESWKESMKKVHADEFLSLQNVFEARLEELMALQETLEKAHEDATGESEKESAYAALIGCQASIGSIMQDMKKTEFDFIKAKTTELIEILNDLSSWKGGSKTEEAKKRILACYMTKNPSLDLTHLSLTSLPKCLTSFSHLTHLNCSHNLLTTLPLLSTLQVLNCSFNRLCSLPSFPKNVKINTSVNPYLEMF